MARGEVGCYIYVVQTVLFIYMPQGVDSVQVFIVQVRRRSTSWKEAVYLGIVSYTV